MLQAGKIQVIPTESKDIVHIRHLHRRRNIGTSGPTPPQVASASATDKQDDFDDDAEFMDAFDQDEEEDPSDNIDSSEAVTDQEESKFIPYDEWQSNVSAEKGREAARKLYTNVVKWSIKYSHELGQPEHGWTVDLTRCVCNCRFTRSLACAHMLWQVDLRSGCQSPVLPSVDCSRVVLLVRGKRRQDQHRRRRSVREPHTHPKYGRIPVRAQISLSLSPRAPVDHH
jgi:hypothetical protein